MSNAASQSRVWQTRIGPERAEIPTGSLIELSGFRPQLLDTAKKGLTREDDLSALRGVALQLAGISDGKYFPWGSGILVAPGIGITAKHVYDEFKVKLGTGFGLAAIGANGSVANFWTVHQVLSIGGTDLSLLTLDFRTPWAEKLDIKLPELHLCLPKVGDQVFSFGFRAAEENFHCIDNATKLGVLGISSIGTVTAVYPSGRDRSNLPGPCFEVDMPTVSGMSGGPVFDSFGRLIGLISTSFHWGPDDGVTFVSLLWTAAFRKIMPVWPPGMYSEPTNLREISETENNRCYLSYSDCMRWDGRELRVYISDPQS